MTRTVTRILAWCRPCHRLCASLALSIVVGCGLAFGLSAVADESKKPDTAILRFQIPSQPLAEALQAYSAISGVAVLYASGVEFGQNSIAIDGEYTREVALKMLLGDSGLQPRYARSDAIALVNPAAPDLDVPPDSPLSGADLSLGTIHITNTASAAPDRDALMGYISAIQQDIRQALRKSPTTRDGGYRVGVDLWVDPARTIQRTEVFRSTGDSERDIAVVAALQGVVIRQPAPARVPQPVRVMIVVQSR